MSASYLRETLMFFAHRGPIAYLGVAFFAIGAFFWCLPRLPGIKRVLAYRDLYATALRAQGKSDRAKEIDEETECSRRRPPIYGRALVAIGLVFILASPFLPA